MMLTMDDPARRYSITIGYSESHIKGGHGYRDPFYYNRDPFYYDRDPFYDRNRFYDRDPFYGRNEAAVRDPLYSPIHRMPEDALIERP